MAGTYTYNPDDPAATDRDKVRTWIFDTEAPFMWTDQQIAGYVTLFGAPCRAAVFLLRQRAARAAATGSVTRSIGNTSISEGGGGAENWAQLADDLEALCATVLDPPVMATAGPALGNQSPPIFTVGMFDMPGDGDPWPTEPWPREP